MKAAEHVGLIGTGYIGHGLADCLLNAGFPLHVHDVNSERCEDLVQRGALLEDSPRAVADACEVVFIAVVSGDQVEQVLFGEAGAARAEGSCRKFINTATIAPSCARRLAERLGEGGAELLDAPLIGGRDKGRSETMPVGGSRAAFERCRELLETVAKNVVYAGPSGSGEVVKLMNQMIVCANMAARAEAVVYAENMGVSLEAADRALGKHDRAVGWLAGAAKRQEVHGDPTHYTRLFLKDMNCFMEAGYRMPVARAVADLNARAMTVEPENGWPYSFLAAARAIAQEPPHCSP